MKPIPKTSCGAQDQLPVRVALATVYPATLCLPELYRLYNDCNKYERKESILKR